MCRYINACPCPYLEATSHFRVKSPSQRSATLLPFQKLFLRTIHCACVHLPFVFSQEKGYYEPFVMSGQHVTTSGSRAQSKGFQLAQEFGKEHTNLMNSVNKYGMLKRTKVNRHTWSPFESGSVASSPRVLVTCTVGTFLSHLSSLHLLGPNTLLIPYRRPLHTLTIPAGYLHVSSHATILSPGRPGATVGRPDVLSLCLRRSTKAATIDRCVFREWGCWCLIRCTESWFSLWHLRFPFRLLTRRREANFAAGFEVLGPESFAVDCGIGER